MSDQEIEVLNRKMDRILFYLNNDGDTGKKGVIAQLESLSKDFYKFRDEYRTAQAVRTAKIGLIGSLGGVVGAGIVWLIKIFT